MWTEIKVRLIKCNSILLLNINIIKTGFVSPSVFCNYSSNYSPASVKILSDSSREEDAGKEGERDCG